MNSSTITFSNVWKFYGENSVLKKVSYTFDSQTIYILKGENGSGKTSLLSVFAGLASYQEGSISFLENGRQILFSKMDNRKISSAFSIDSCYGGLTIKENLKLSLPICSDKDMPKQDQIIELFKLGKFKNKKYSELSKGFQQRTTLAAAFLNNPLWIVLDEPSVYLDQESLIQLISNIKLYHNLGTSFFISTHEKLFFESLNSTVLTMDQGELRP